MVPCKLKRPLDPQERTTRTWTCRKNKQRERTFNPKINMSKNTTEFYYYNVLNKTENVFIIYGTLCPGTEHASQFRNLLELVEELLTRQAYLKDPSCQLNGIRFKRWSLYSGIGPMAVSYTHLTLPTTPYV